MTHENPFHEIVDPSYGESPSVRRRREEARRADHEEISRTEAIGDVYATPKSSTAEHRHAMKEQLRADLARKKQLDAVAGAVISIAGRANALLNILDYEKIRHQRDKLAEKSVRIPRVEDSFDSLYERREEGLTYLFPEGTDPDGSLRQELQDQLDVTGEEGRIYRENLAAQLRHQADIMGFKVSSPKNK